MISNSFKKYFKNTSWFFIDYIIRFIFSFFVGILLARFLQPENYGILSYSLTTVALFASLASLGMDYVIIKKLIEFKERRDEILGTAFILKLVGSIISLLLIYTYLLFIKEKHIITVYVLFIALGLLFRPFSVIELFNQSNIEARKNSIVRIISTLIISILKLLLIFLRVDLIYFIFSYLLLDIINMSGFVIIYKMSKLKFSKWKVNVNLLKDVLYESWPLLISTISVTGYMKIDQIMIRNLVNMKSVGIYSIAVKLTEFWYFVPVLITGSLFPAIVKLKNNDKKYKEYLQLLINFLLLISLFIAIPIILLSKHIVLTLYGKEFIEAYKILQVYGWIILFVYIGAIRGKWLIMENLQIYLAVFGIIGFFINVILNFILIRRNGPLGAAIASLISQIFTNYLLFAISKNTRIMFIMQTKAFLQMFKIKDYKKIIEKQK